jgi:hypothetical protein
LSLALEQSLVGRATSRLPAGTLTIDHTVESDGTAPVIIDALAEFLLSVMLVSGTQDPESIGELAQRAIAQALQNAQSGGSNVVPRG